MTGGVNSAGNAGSQRLEKINTIYATEVQEPDRTKEDFSFGNLLLGQNPKDIRKNEELNDDKIYKKAQAFYDGLINHKSTLMNGLNITEEQYDAFSCIALALASQETGFGFENGYKTENELGILGRYGITLGSNIGLCGSASSGLTQMKIDDFIDDNRLSDKEKQLLSTVNAKKSGLFGLGNTLYKDPAASAGATVIVLKSIWDEYENFKAKLDVEHENSANRLSENGVSLQEASEMGKEVISKICTLYDNATTDTERANIRDTFYYWILSTNGSKINSDADENDKYNEENNFNELKRLFGNSDILDENSLECVRYVMSDTSGNSEYYMNELEYCAYAWNMGTNTEDSNKPDRLIGVNISTMLVDPEVFDYEYFASNVSSLAYNYAAQFNQIDNPEVTTEEEKALGQKFLQEALKRQ